MFLTNNASLHKLFGFTGLEPTELNKRMSLIQLGALTVICGTIYCLMYIALGYSNMAYPCLIYIGIYFVNFIIFLKTKNYNYYQATQPFLILLAIIVNHIVIGNFVDSSAVIFASLLAPVIALTFASQKTAQVYYYLFLVSVIIAGLWDLFLAAPGPKLPAAIYTIFFINNIIAVGSIIYFLINGFLNKNLKLQAELQESLANLKLTQSQLIQSEKMASLGVLTAGIAHEIQNPLNFVNNFSEVSTEMLKELKEEKQKAIRDLDYEQELLNDIEQNLIKIIHHGKRADAIVKGMLLHSRSSTGKKELTDINALAEEYLRLSYHGLRAKDKSFNARLVNDFDPQLGSIEVIPQDLGRVLLNLFNNAFYATHDKQQKQNSSYQPEVRVSTKKKNNYVEIKVRDNGNGIPEHVRQKIFQPFFTTKPTGQGTGLGLSLSYDIITKAHNGEINLQTEEGEFTEFTITLPVNVNINTKTNLTL
ncbi:sensor histidine kinase [Adhaeribacter rhizoryzae]|nr:ATP-binding protein [Adhaeribacter rhizoryzae]